MPGVSMDKWPEKGQLTISTSKFTKSFTKFRTTQPQHGDTVAILGPAAVSKTYCSASLSQTAQFGTGGPAQHFIVLGLRITGEKSVAKSCLYHNPSHTKATGL
ncbi:hypothetical protein H9L39_10714 [Fusarium oxysporum f. sp. albedinis]|nr:hypothetical protein H9L39_10714 [Fusarium oxysporum f. sp. albedinis]